MLHSNIIFTGFTGQDRVSKAWSLLGNLWPFLYCGKMNSGNQCQFLCGDNSSEMDTMSNRNYCTRIAQVCLPRLTRPVFAAMAKQRHLVVTDVHQPRKHVDESVLFSKRTALRLEYLIGFHPTLYGGLYCTGQMSRMTNGP